MPSPSYSAEEWDQHHPLIKQLYTERNMTVEQVRHHLGGIGFSVTTRMVKTRLRSWGLYKHFRLPELRTTLKILGSDRSQWPSEAPRFLIHRSVVDLDYILRSFGRKGIKDPFEWVRTTSDKDYEHSTRVELLTDTTPTESEKEHDHVGSLFGNSRSSLPQTPASTSSTSLVLRGRPGIPFPRPCDVPSTVDRLIPDPDVYVQAATVVHRVQSFCLKYMASADSVDEPEVHRFTCHARFLDQMDEGLFLHKQENYPLAFEKFGNGFDLLKDMLVDLHPMGIAVYCLLLCKLSIQKVKPVLAALPRYAYELAGILKPVPRDLVELLGTISKSRDFLAMPLLCLRAASDVLEENDMTHWKTLYVKERHCDALYYAHEYGEVATRRAQLLKLQEVKYGPSARNVLWTSLNVADDHLIHNRLGEAEVRFGQVLLQADEHSDYHRVKTLVVALEGLARVAYLRATVQLGGLELAPQLLSRALGYSNEALELAQFWFQDSTRRINRLLILRDMVQSTLDSLSC